MNGNGMLLTISVAVTVMLLWPLLMHAINTRP